jgi:arylsulfatase A-like enzyme
MKKNIFLSLFLVSILIFQGCKNIQNTSEENAETKPNIIFILADDLGYGDLGCYGQSKFETPNLDELAAEGLLFTQHYSGSTVCAPSRASLMTGLHTGHTYVRGNKSFRDANGVRLEGQFPLADSIVTVAEMLKDAGYKTGMFGKWGLGAIGSSGEPAKQGFDEFFGFACQGLAHRYYPTHLWHNTEKVILEGK